MSPEPQSVKGNHGRYRSETVTKQRPDDYKQEMPAAKNRVLPNIKFSPHPTSSKLSSVKAQHDAFRTINATPQRGLDMSQIKSYRGVDAVTYNSSFRPHFQSVSHNSSSLDGHLPKLHVKNHGSQLGDPNFSLPTPLLHKKYGKVFVHSNRASPQPR